ncbi:MAG: DUF5655 domain-containing protein [Saonia sp.]
MENGLLKKTGKPLKHWMKVVKDSKIEKHKAIIEFLKSKHNFTYGFANFVSLKFREADANSISDEILLENQYKGKESLLPIYAEIKKFLEDLEDVELVAKKAYVSTRAQKQFAIIQPSTKTRLDLGIKFPKDVSIDLEESGNFNAMVSHRVRLESPEAFNKEVKEYLKMAYEATK